jgi:site-specific recombinase XerC
MQIMLGHASIRTTQVYGRLNDEHVRVEAERVEAAPPRGLARGVSGGRKGDEK